MSSEPCPRARPQDHDQLTLADIVRSHADELGPVAPQQARALAAIADCRTEALGGHRYGCDSCSHQLLLYNSCRNRNCPQCGSLRQTQWVERRQADLLPVEYFHVVFTVAGELHPLFLANPARAYTLLFQAAADSLLELARDPRLIGADLGLMAVLHTWSQTLTYHPHVHCIVPGGGPSLNGTRWVSCRNEYLVPVRALSVLFRGKLLSRLQKALDAGHIQPPAEFNTRRALKRAARKKWHVYAKPSLLGPYHVIQYLGRYTHRIAISNDRILTLRKGQVTFRYRDRTRDDRTRMMTLPAHQFLRRFLLHVLPSGFVRIRYFGGLAHATRRLWLERSRQLLTEAGVPVPPAPAPLEAGESWQELLRRLTGRDFTKCPRCPTGRMIHLEQLDPLRPEHRSRPPPAPT